MSKQEFLDELAKGLSGAPKAEKAGRLAFYSEMIDDYIEEGLTEEEAVAKIGSVDEVVTECIADIPLTKLFKEKWKCKGSLNGWQIALIAVGIPIGFSLIASAFAVLFSLYVSLWAVVVSLWAGFGALVGCGFGGVLGSLLFICTGNAVAGFAVFGGALACLGLAIFAFYGCKSVTKGSVWLTKKMVVAIKKCFMKKERKI